MKKLLCAFLMLLAGGLFAESSDVVVVDAEDNSPVVAASVFSQKGKIIGITGLDGKIAGVSPDDFPVMVKSLGYRSAEVDSLCGTIALPRETYELGEVIISPKDRPIMRAICYVREYETMVISYEIGDTAQISIAFKPYTESMGDFYLATTKVKKFKNSYRLPISRCYSSGDVEGKIDGNTLAVDTLIHIGDTLEIKHNQSLTVFTVDDDFPIPDATVNEADKIRQGAKSDVIMGKHGIKTIARKENNVYIETVDGLADKKNHKYSPNALKLFGLTSDLTKETYITAYRGNNSGVYNPWDLLYRTISSEVLLKGKLWRFPFKTKKPIAMKSYVEIYPVAIEFLTVDEAKEMQENPPKVEFRRSPIATLLPPRIKAMVEHADSVYAATRKASASATPSH